MAYNKKQLLASVYVCGLKGAFSAPLRTLYMDYGTKWCNWAVYCDISVRTLPRHTLRYIATYDQRVCRETLNLHGIKRIY